MSFNLKHFLYLSFIITLACLSALSTRAAAESTDSSKRDFQNRLSSEILERNDRFLTFVVENDSFGSGTDENYTSGVRATYMKVGERPGEIGRFLDRHIPTFEFNETTSVFYSAGQNLYTPEDITRVRPDPDDRPYAAFLYGSAGFASITNDHIDTIEATLGIVGPWALGEQTQEHVHKIVDADDPAGWDAQLDNEPGIILAWERRWPEAWTSRPSSLLVRIAPHMGAAIGNIYSYASTGASLQLLPQDAQWQSQPLRVRPAIPGSGVFAVPEGKFAWSLFTGIEGRAVGRNIFLDGNTFEDSPEVDKKHFVLDANVGATLTYGATRLSYTLNWRSKEFDNQDNSSLFGAISIGRRF